MRRRQRERERRAVEDADFERELANEIGRLFPGCPPECVKEIASHTGRRGSGRVGRTASARALDPTAITLAVAAAARHRESEYDDLLMAGVDRSQARERVRATVGSVLEHAAAATAVQKRSTPILALSVEQACEALGVSALMGRCLWTHGCGIMDT